MIQINLRDFYPECYRSDCFVEVPEELAMQLRLWKLADEARRIKILRNKAYYSLDRDDGIASAVALSFPSIEVLIEKQEEKQLLYSKIALLPRQQRRRIYAHYFLEMDIRQIAELERVSQSAVYASIDRGLRRLQKLLRNSF